MIAPTKFSMDATESGNISGKVSKYYLAKQSPSEQTVTSSNKNVLDDCVDITEDDLPDRKDDSDTDSDSYWSPVEEEQEEEGGVVCASGSLEAQRTDDYLGEDVVQTAILKKADSIGPREGVRMVVTDSGNMLLEEEIKAEVECNVEQGIPQGLGEDVLTENSMSVSCNDNEETVESFVEKIVETEAQKLVDEGNINLETINEGVEVQSEDETSTFQNYHLHIAENLVKKTGKNGNKFENDTVDAFVRSRSIRKPAISVEKCLAAYVVIDQFDVKISERSRLDSLPDTVDLMGKLHAFAAGVRRTMSLRRPKMQEAEFEIRGSSRRTKSDSWAVKKQPIEEFVNLDYQKRTEKSGEVVEVIVVSRQPKKN